MQETSHYQLAQWDGADRILREVFNRDNARIDAALAAAEGNLAEVRGKAGTQFIRTVRASENADAVEMDLSDISWNDWSAVHMTITPVLSGGGVVSVYVDGTSIGRMDAYPAHVVLYPVFSSAVPVWGVFLSVSGSSAFAVGTKFSSLASIELRTNSSVQLQKNTKIVMRGVK